MIIIIDINKNYMRKKSRENKLYENYYFKLIKYKKTEVLGYRN